MSSVFAANTYIVKNLTDSANSYFYSTLNAISPSGMVFGTAYAPIDDTNRFVAILTDTTGTTQELIPGTESGSQAFDINASEQVLVYADGGVVYGHGVTIAAGVYIWQNGGLTPANLNVSLDPSTVRLAFHDSAQIMGTGNFTVGATTQKHAFLATHGLVVDLGTLPGASAGYAIYIPYSRAIRIDIHIPPRIEMRSC